MNGEAIRPVPKPVKRQPKDRKPLRAKRWGVSRSKRGTAHGRRSREWGRMTWLHSLRVCFVRAFFLERWIGGGDDEQMAFAVADRLAEASGAGVPILDCAGEFQVAHLYGRYDNGDRKTILACRDHHQDIDQTRRWFRILTKPERLWLKNFLARRATLAWESLPSEERTRWDEIGARRFARGPREA